MATSATDILSAIPQCASVSNVEIDARALPPLPARIPKIRGQTGRYGLRIHYLSHRGIEIALEMDNNKPASVRRLDNDCHVSANLGFGNHFWDIDPNNAEGISKVSLGLFTFGLPLHMTDAAGQLYYSIQMLYVVILILVKGAIVAFFRRIFPRRSFQIVVYIVLTVLVLHGLLFVLLIMFECTPVASIWDRSLDRKCIDINAVTLASAVLSIVEDFVILAMPIPELRRLKLTRKQKTAVVLLFSLGSFTCITSMVRIRWLSIFVDPYDMTWERVDLVNWSVAEISSALLCGSLPALRPLFKKIPDLIAIMRGERPDADIKEPLETYRKGNNKICFSNISHGLISMSQLYMPHRRAPDDWEKENELFAARRDIERHIGEREFGHDYDRVPPLAEPLRSHPPWRARDSQSTISTTTYSSLRSPTIQSISTSSGSKSPTPLLRVKEYESSSRNDTRNEVSTNLTRTWW
ncbi:putative integral membrane protein [Colletotrichum sublineola]|uniref:Putative integral membrane protein n=1 Tax=Colletotrichum sublineola TaxID=1173701 RepID=A0A066Y2G5_COLSU|nr:putative integral membrane protein [Colletotrichum sublineola]